MAETFSPYYRLWGTAIDFQYAVEEWTNGNLLSLQAAEVQSSVEGWNIECQKVLRLFEPWPTPHGVASDLRDAIQEFSQNLPVINNLCREAMQSHHWQELFDRIDADVDMEEGLTLQTLLDYDILDHLDIVESVSSVAQKQWGLKNALQQMKVEWKSIGLSTKPYDVVDVSTNSTAAAASNSTNRMILDASAFAQIQVLLDDHIANSQQLRSSPYSEPFLRELKDWESKLVYVQDSLNQILEVQNTWTQLEPLFREGENNIRDMPQEFEKFKAVDQHWQNFLQIVQEMPIILDLVEAMETLHSGFVDANRKLDEVSRNVSDYIASKRVDFNRFFFLSNQEVIELMANTKSSPQKVQPYLEHLFEGIHSLEFDLNDFNNYSNSSNITKNNTVSTDCQRRQLLVHAVFDRFGERLQLTTPIDVMSPINAGHAQNWLSELAYVTTESLKDQIALAVKATVGLSLEEWIFEWPGQVVLAAEKLGLIFDLSEQFSAREPVGSILATTNKRWKEVLSLLKSEILHQDDHDENEKKRRIISAFFMQSSHHRDLVEFLARKNC